MYGYESSAILTTDILHYKLQTRPLVREGVPRRRAKQLLGEKKGKRKIRSWVPKGCTTQRRIGRLTVGHNIISTQNYVCKTTLVKVSSTIPISRCTSLSFTIAAPFCEKYRNGIPCHLANTTLTSTANA
jgi:hypothetical protein